MPGIANSPLEERFGSRDHTDGPLIQYLYRIDCNGAGLGGIWCGVGDDTAQPFAAENQREGKRNNGIDF